MLSQSPPELRQSDASSAQIISGTSQSKKHLLLWQWFNLACLFILLVGFSYFYPALNWPDEAYKLGQIDVSPNPYFAAIRPFVNPYCHIEWAQDYRVEFGSNRFQFSLVSGKACYAAIKTVHLALAIGSILLIFFSLSKENAWLFVLSLLLPVSVLLLTGINNQLVFHIVSTLFGVLLLRGARPWLLILGATLLLPFDRTFVTLIVFLATLLAIRLYGRWSLIGFISILIVFQIELLPFQALARMFIGVEDLAAVQTSLSRFSDGLVASLVYFYLTMVYLGGTSTIFGLGPEYLVVLAVMLVGYVKMKDRRDFHVYFLAFLATYLIILNLVPTIQSYRYFVFAAPILLFYLVPKMRHQQYVAFYSIFMSVVYLSQALFIDALR